MKSCWHIQERHYIDGAVKGYIDPYGVVSNDPDLPDVKVACKTTSTEIIKTVNPFLAGDDEYTIFHPFSHDLTDNAYMDCLVPLYSEEECRHNDELNRQRASRRASQAVEDIARSGLWRYFLTLTFSANCGFDRYFYPDCLDALELFCKNLRRRFPGVRYIFVPEQHKDGAFHFHGLIGGCDLSAMLKDSGKKCNHKPIYNLDAGWNYGFSTVSLVQKQGAVGRYISKYITKDMAVPKGKKRYLSSNNLKRSKDIVVKKRIDFVVSDMLDAIYCGMFTDGIVPDRVRKVYVPVLDRHVYYYEIYGSEGLICA